MSRDYHANTWLLQSLAPMYYRNANCAVVVYDITQAVSHRVKRERESRYDTETTDSPGVCGIL